VELRTSVKNRVHARLTQWGIFFEAADLFGKAGREMLAALKLSPSRRKILDDLLLLVDTFSELIKGWEKMLGRMLPSNKEVELLCTLPGIGPIIAHTLLAEIGEVERFPSPGHLISCAALAPYTRQSGDRLWQGRLCKMGNSTMRTAMVEAAWAAVRCSPEVRERYEYLRYRKGPQTAIVAVARGMLEIVWHMLVRRTPYKPFRRTGPSAP
jgi:transposase